MRRWLSVILPLTALVAGCSVGSSSGSNNATAVSQAQPTSRQRLHGQGLVVSLPRGWHGRIATRRIAFPGAAVVYFASFPLPPGDDESGAKAERAIKRDDALVVLTETPVEAALGAQTRKIPVGTRGATVGRFSVVDQNFIANGRGFLLHATFGAPRPPAPLVRRINSVLARMTVARRAHELLAADDPMPPSALVPARLLPTPRRVLTQCRLAQSTTRFPILCPKRLPRPSLGWPQNDRLPEVSAQRLPAPGVSWRSRSDPRYRHHEAGGVSITYGAPWEPDSGPDWRRHLWRNRPCCFLHFEVFRVVGGPKAVPADASAATLGGRRGLLKDAGSWGLASATNDYLYFANHTRFLWRQDRVTYVATLHRFGTKEETRALLARLIAELRPVRELSQR